MNNKINKLMININIILILLTKINDSSVQQKKIDGFHQKVIDNIMALSDTLNNTHYKNIEKRNIIYCICAALDEFILKQSWSIDIKWSQKTLLSLLFKDNFGGEHFYSILDCFLKNPEKYIDFIEICYVLLCLGFEGKYHGEEIENKTTRKKLIKNIKQDIFSIREHDFINKKNNLTFNKNKVSYFIVLKKQLFKFSLIYLSVIFLLNFILYFKLRMMINFIGYFK